jgi:VIT1/CCC1 family predicted Fe2+/Mn2+ transporter
MLNKEQLNEFLDSFDYVSNKTELLLEELKKFKNTDIQIKEELNKLKVLLNKFYSLEERVKSDISEIIRKEIESIVRQNEKSLNNQIKSMNFLLKKVEKLETLKSNCFIYFFVGAFIGLIPFILTFIFKI